MEPLSKCPRILLRVFCRWVSTHPEERALDRLVVFVVGIGAESSGERMSVDKARLSSWQDER